ncbi:MAG: IS630 family transposase [Anaerolineae bacterium]|nr:IS630 family transposase [Anaerolineae bacterium]
MAIRVRSITAEESEILDRWERGDNIVCYRRARILRLSEADWRCPAIAEVLALHVETVRWTIKTFNEGGIEAITPQPRSGGRPPGYTQEIADVAEDLARQEPPGQEGRATWTLHGLAKAIAARFDHIDTMSHEAVRRLLKLRDIAYYRAKQWLTSPDPLYEQRKRRRDRLLALARAAPDGAAYWLDQSWFSRWPYRFRAWAAKDTPLRVAQRWSEKVDTTALYAALDDESQEAFLRWATGQPDSEETVQFLEALMAHCTQNGLRFIVLIWDKASWHTSRRTQGWIRAYNRRAKEEALARLIVCQLPTRSPWLMPLEPIFGWTKHQILGGRLFQTVAQLQAAVESYFHQRVAHAKERRDQACAKAQLVPTQNSVSVL